MSTAAQRRGRRGGGEADEIQQLGQLEGLGQASWRRPWRMLLSSTPSFPKAVIMITGTFVVLLELVDLLGEVDAVDVRHHQVGDHQLARRRR